LPAESSLKRHSSDEADENRAAAHHRSDDARPDEKQAAAQHGSDDAHTSSKPHDLANT